MDTFSSIVLGVVQGLTEFIPVSSSGHLVIAQKLLPNFSQQGIVFDVFLHLGTLLAVFVYFRKKIISLLEDPHYLVILFVGTIPAVVVGFLFKDYLESSYKLGGIFLGIQFLITSLFCFLTDKKTGTRTNITIKDSWVIGLSQAFAILPAVSRSGATIFTAVTRGIKNKEAAEYSFLLSIPAILGANILEIISHQDQVFPLSNAYGIGFLVSFLTGMFSIYVTIRFLYKKMFKVFAVYTLALGVLVTFI